MDLQTRMTSEPVSLEYSIGSLTSASALWVPKTCATWPDAPAARWLFGPAPGLPGHGMISGLWA
jgi:hypothetical protein